MVDDDLLTPEARAELRAQSDADHVAMKQRWPRTIIWSLLAGAGNSFGGLLYGLSGRDALVIGAAISITVFVVIVTAGWLRGRPIVPQLRTDRDESDD